MGNMNFFFCILFFVALITIFFSAQKLLHVESILRIVHIIFVATFFKFLRRFKGSRLFF